MGRMGAAAAVAAVERFPTRVFVHANEMVAGVKMRFNVFIFLIIDAGVTFSATRREVDIPTFSLLNVQAKTHRGVVVRCDERK